MRSLRSFRGLSATLMFQAILLHVTVEIHASTKLSGKHIYIFDPTMEMHSIQRIVDSIFARQSPKKSEFSCERYALLFKPGSYELDIRVGYYMQVAGLGLSPEEVTIKGSVRSNSIDGRHQLTNFWRSVENLTIEPMADSTNVWGVSQAAPMRRVYIKGNLHLHDRGYASGGFMADTKIDGTVSFGPQQQWFSRNCSWIKCRRGAWNIFSMGVEGAPATNWPDGPYTSLPTVHVSREKPYLSLSNGRYRVMLPRSRLNSTGVSWDNDQPCNRELDLSDFYITDPSKDNASTLNEALKEGWHLLITPGIYELGESLRVDHPGTVIMGLGMPSLIPTGGNPVLEIADIGGVTVSGLLLDAGKIESPVLLKVGDYRSGLDHSKNPTWLFDIFCRVGGAAAGSVTKNVEINSHDVFLDHAWLWRADHGSGVGWDLNRSACGLAVNGDRVTVYGLFNEHHQEYQTLWNGEEGRVYLYQSEMPYDPPSSVSWKHENVEGYASYKVADHVKSHIAWGIGVYCVFKEAAIQVENAIETPPSLEDDLHHKFTFWLNGIEGSTIRSIINGKGESVHKDHRRSNLK